MIDTPWRVSLCDPDCRVGFCNANADGSNLLYENYVVTAVFVHTTVFKYYTRYVRYWINH